MICRRWKRNSQGKKREGGATRAGAPDASGSFGDPHLFLQLDVAKSHDVMCLEGETPSACESNIFIHFTTTSANSSGKSSINFFVHIILVYFFWG